MSIVHAHCSEIKADNMLYDVFCKEDIENIPAFKEWVDNFGAKIMRSKGNLVMAVWDDGFKWIPIGHIDSFDEIDLPMYAPKYRENHE